MTPTPAITDIVGEVGTVVTRSIGWMKDYASAITQNNVLLLGCIAVPLVGLGCGLLARLLRRKV